MPSRKTKITMNQAACLGRTLRLLGASDAGSRIKRKEGTCEKTRKRAPILKSKGKFKKNPHRITLLKLEKGCAEYQGHQK